MKSRNEACVYLYKTPLRLRRKLFIHILNTNNLTNECKGYILLYPD